MCQRLGHYFFRDARSSHRASASLTDANSTHFLGPNDAGALHDEETPPGLRSVAARLPVKMGSIARLNGRGLCLSPTRNSEAVKNYPRGVGTIECVEVNTGNVVIQKIMTLFQGEVNPDAADHFGIVFASL
jgi:hypothetical protein